MSRIPSLQLADLASRWQSVAKLFKRSAFAIGLDVGSALVKGVLVSHTPEGVKLLQIATAAVSSESDPAKRVEAIQTVVRSLQSEHEARIVTAVGGSNAVLRVVLLPKMSPQELKAALSFESEKYIPFKLEEVYLDFAIVGDRPGGRMEVLLAAARQDLVDAHLELLRSASVTPHAVDLEALALANAWEIAHPKTKTVVAQGSKISKEAGPAERPEVVGLIHVGARGTILVFLQGSQLQFTRESAIGGNAFTQAIVEKLGLDPLEAEKIKCQPQTQSAQVRMILQPVWEEWLTQCRVSFDFYENQFGHQIQRLLLSGGSARLAGFKEWIGEILGLPIEAWDPVGQLATEVDPQHLELHRSRLGVALGLAVRELS